MRSFARLCSVIALFAFATPAPSAWAQTKSEAGFIEDFADAPTLYELKRDDELRPVSICHVLLNGDVVTVLDPRGKLTLRLIDRADAVVLTLERGPFVVSAEPAKRGFASGLLAWFAGEADVMDRSKKQRFAANIRAGGDRFSVPILRRPQTIAAGQRALTLDWRGGKPVDIVLRAQTGGKPLLQAKASGGRWTGPAIKLAPGAYSLVVTAPDGTSATGRLMALAPGQMPQAPDDLARPEIPAPLRLAAQAAWLASRDDGAFMFEAFQMLAPLRGKFAPADTLALALADDRPPAAAP